MKTDFSKFPIVLFLSLFFVLASNAQESKKSDKSENKTEINLTKQDKSEDCPQSGVARLRVTFDKSGVVTKAKIISSVGCKSLDKQALEAAKGIKFEPAKKDGKKITQVKIVEYKFTINN